MSNQNDRIVDNHEDNKPAHGYATVALATTENSGSPLKSAIKQTNSDSTFEGTESHVIPGGEVYTSITSEGCISRARSTVGPSAVMSQNFEQRAAAYGSNCETILTRHGTYASASGGGPVFVSASAPQGGRARAEILDDSDVSPEDNSEKKPSNIGIAGIVTGFAVILAVFVSDSGRQITSKIWQYLSSIFDNTSEPIDLPSLNISQI